MPRFVPEQVSDADIAALVDYLLDETAKPLPGRSYYDALQPVPEVANTDTLTFFPQTGHTVTGGFKAYWEANGGLAIFGYPITEEYAGYTEDGAWDFSDADNFTSASDFAFSDGSGNGPCVAVGRRGSAPAPVACGSICNAAQNTAEICPNG